MTDTASEQQIVQLRQELWAARDAAIGATAELGAARARISELEVLVGQLQTELQRREAEMRSRAVQLTLRMARPVRRLRGLPR